VTGAARCGRRAPWCEWCASDLPSGPRAGGGRPRPRVSPVMSAKCRQRELSLARCERVTAVAGAARRAPAPDGPAQTYPEALAQSPAAAGPVCRPSPLPGPLVAVEMPFSSTFSAAAGAAELLRGRKVAQNLELLALSNVAEMGIGSRGHALAMGPSQL